jgi:tetratricopeptide (TPR) repeat protein
MFRKAFVFCPLFFLSLFLQAQNTLVKTTEEDLFRTGLELLDRERYSAAREYFQRFINLNTSDVRSIDAEYYIALSALNLENADAESRFHNFIEKYPFHSKSSLAYYDLGSFYYNKQKYEKAIEYLEKTDQSQLNSSQKLESRFRLAYAYFNQKNFEKAGPVFNEIKNGDHKYTSAANYYGGYVEFRNGDYDAALTDLKKAEQNSDYKNIVPLMIVNVYYKQNASEELIAYAEDVLKNRPDVKNADDIFLLTADAYFRKKEYKRAAELFHKYAEKIKPGEEIQYRMALSEYMINDFVAAVKDFKPIAMNKDSLGQSAAYYLGLSYIKSNNKDFALAAFDQARHLNFSRETKEEALFNFAKVNYDLERYKFAIPPFREFVKEFPKSAHSAEVSELLSESYLRSPNYSEAVIYIETLKSRTPRINSIFQHVAFYKGAELFNDQLYKDAIVMFDKSMNFPVDRDIYLASVYWKAEALSTEKEYFEAIPVYHTVLAKAPHDHELALKAKYGIGYCYFNLKQYKEALEHFKNYVHEAPGKVSKINYDDAVLRLADCYYATKDYEQAVKFYDQIVISKSPDLDYAYYQKGVVLGIMEKVEPAKASLDMVISQFPNSIYYDDALFQKAQLDLQSSAYVAAAEEFSIIIRNRPNSGYVPYAIQKRALANTNLKKYNEAMGDYDIIFSQYLNHPVINEAIIGVKDPLTAMDKLDQLPKYVDAFRNAHPESTSLEDIDFETAQSLVYSQKYPAAIEALNKFIKAYPNSAKIKEAKASLADSYYRNNDYDNAFSLYKSIAAEKNSGYTKAVQRLAEISLKQNSFEQSKNYYLILLTNGNKKERTNAWMGLIETYFNLKTYDSVSFYANQILEHGNPAPDASSKATLYLGKAAYAKGQNDEAVDYFLRTLNAAKDRNGVEAQYSIAEIQYKEKKYKQSLETLYALNKSYTYDDWLGRSFLLIADNFIAMEEFFQAKATLNSIIEKSPHKESVEKAKLKLAELEGKEKGSNE